MTLTPTKKPGEAILSACLVTPRDPERAKRVLARAPAREARPVKKPARVFFDPENQPRGQVGQMPPSADDLPVAREREREPLLAFVILDEICRAYDLSVLELMGGCKAVFRLARHEAFYMLLLACNMSAGQVAQLMHYGKSTVLRGASLHAERHGLPVTWGSGKRPKGGGA